MFRNLNYVGIALLLIAFNSFDSCDLKQKKNLKKVAAKAYYLQLSSYIIENFLNCFKFF